MPFRLASICLAAVVLTAPAAWGQTDPIEFTLSNATEHTLTHLYISLPSTADWEEDILGVDVVRPGQTVAVSIDDGLDECVYDIRADFSDGDSIQIAQVDFCDLDGSELVVE